MEFPEDAVTLSDDNRRIRLRVRDLPVIDSFQFFGPNEAPASVSFDIEWRATGPVTAVGQGAAVPPTDPGAFLGRHTDAFSSGTFAGTGLGFRFRSDGRASTEGGYGEIVRERNGVFLTEALTADE